MYWEFFQLALESHSQFQTINNEWSVGGCAAWRGRAEGPGLHFLIFPSFHSGLCAGMEAGNTGPASPLVCSRIFTRTLFRLCFVLPQLALRSLTITLLHPTHYLPLRPGAWRIRLLHNSYFIQCMRFVSYFVVLAVSQCPQWKSDVCLWQRCNSARAVRLYGRTTGAAKPTNLTKSIIIQIGCAVSGPASHQPHRPAPGKIKSSPFVHLNIFNA